MENILGASAPSLPINMRGERKIHIRAARPANARTQEANSSDLKLLRQPYQRQSRLPFVAV